MHKRQVVLGALGMGAVALGGAITWKLVSSALRRRQLRSGEIRELQSLWTRVGNCRIHAQVSFGGKTPGSVPVVLLHGCGISSSYFVPLAERLAPEFDVLAVDLPGHGKSDTPVQPLGVEELADSLVAWMDANELRRVCVVGHSLGCQIAVDAAVRYPDRFDRLVLLGPTIDPSARTLTQYAWKMFLGGFYEVPSLTKLMIQDYARMGSRLVPEVRSMFRDRIEDKLPRLTVPVLLARGEKDPLARQHWVDQATQLAHAEQVVIPRWGHAAHYSALNQFVQAITPFLRRPAAGSWPPAAQEENVPAYHEQHALGHS